MVMQTPTFLHDFNLHLVTTLQQWSLCFLLWGSLNTCFTVRCFYFKVLDALDEMIAAKRHDPEIEGLRNMLCSKETLAGMLVLCDILKPVIEFSDCLQGDCINFAHVNNKLKVNTNFIQLHVKLPKSDILINFKMLQKNVK